MKDAHHPIPILIARILGPFGPVTVTVGNNSRGVHNLIPDPRGDGVGVRDTMANGWNGWNSFYCECLQEGGS